MSLPHPRLARYAWAVLAANLLVVLWGAVVRATGSGAGCGRHWPRCNGEVLPALESTQTLIEFSHRATSGVAFLLVLGLLLWTRRSVPAGHPARLGAGLAMTFMVAEALAGAGLVWFELVADDRSAARAGSLAVHLVITFFLLASLALTAWWAGGRPPLSLRGAGAWAAGAAALVLVLTGATGAMTALGDTLFPKSTVGLELSAGAHFLERLRVVHPLLAVAGGLIVVGAAAVLVRARPDERTRRLALTVGGLYVGQLAAGALNLVLLVPLWMQLVHLALADALWIALVLTGASALAQPATAGVPAGAVRSTARVG